MYRLCSSYRMVLAVHDGQNYIHGISISLWFCWHMAFFYAQPNFKQRTRHTYVINCRMIESLYRCSENRNFFGKNVYDRSLSLSLSGSVKCLTHIKITRIWWFLNLFQKLHVSGQILHWWRMSIKLWQFSINFVRDFVVTLQKIVTYINHKLRSAQLIFNCHTPSIWWMNAE